MCITHLDTVNTRVSEPDPGAGRLRNPETPCGYIIARVNESIYFLITLGTLLKSLFTNILYLSFGSREPRSRGRLKIDGSETLVNTQFHIYNNFLFFVALLFLYQYYISFIGILVFKKTRLIAVLCKLVIYQFYILQLHLKYFRRQLKRLYNKAVYFFQRFQYD